MVQTQIATVCFEGRYFDIAYTDPDHVKWVKKTGKFLEPDMLGAIQNLKLTGTAIEVGANVGNHVVFYGNFCKFDHVIAIEPNNDSINVLYENVGENDMDCVVTILEAAIGDVRGICGITQKENSGQNKVTAGEDVEMYTLDEVVSKYLGEQKVSLIKIDVEGFESKVLRGAQKTIKKHKPHVFAECHGDPKELLKLFPKFKGGDYGIVKRYNNAPTYHFAYFPFDR